MNRNYNRYLIVLSTILCLSVFSPLAKAVSPEFQISTPKANAVVPGEIIEVSGVGADPTGKVLIEVFTDKWYPQEGESSINADGGWTFGPVYLSGQGTHNNHMIRATIVKAGHRVKSVTVSGIRRQ